MGTHDQRRAVETAVGLGYYETPRAASLGDIADVLDVPKSTLRYRFWNTEQWTTEQVFGEKQSPVASVNRVSSE